jgi:hypothetical protein
MRLLLNPKTSVLFHSAATRILVFTAATGEAIGVEVDEATAAELVAIITAPRPSSAPGGVDWKP